MQNRVESEHILRTVTADQSNCKLVHLTDDGYHAVDSFEARDIEILLSSSPETFEDLSSASFLCPVEVHIYPMCLIQLDDRFMRVVEVNTQMLDTEGELSYVWTVTARTLQPYEEGFLWFQNYLAKLD